MHSVTGVLELLARELLASHWNYWPSIGTIGHQNSAYFFVGTIGQKKNSEEVPKFRGFLTGKTLFTPPFIVSTVQIWTYQRTLYRLLPFKGVVVVFYKPLDNFHGHFWHQRGRLPLKSPASSWAIFTIWPKHYVCVLKFGQKWFS